MIELEWPASLRFGESDLVRLSLVPYQGGYIVKAEFPEHDIQSRPVTIQPQAGYRLSGAARLEGVGFIISPAGEQEQPLALDQIVTWRWTLTPRAPGQQRLFINLTLIWTPVNSFTGEPKQVTIFSRGLDIRVRSFLGMSQTQAMSTGFISLLIGLGLGFGVVIMRPTVFKARFDIPAPNDALVIESLPGMSLKPDENALLQALFSRYARLALENEYFSGYSGARTFLALPIRADGGPDARTIVKIGWREDIQREADNYERFVKHSLPPMTARIQRAPVTTASNRRAAIQYTFIAEPGQSPKSLRQMLLSNPDPTLLQRLFDTFGPGWWMQRRPAAFRIAQEYDRLLPPHLVIRPIRSSAHPVRSLGAGSTPGEAVLQPGDLVQIGRFSEWEPRADGVTCTLYGTPQPGHAALRVRWLAPNPPGAFTSGQVVDTRASLFASLTAGLDRYGLTDPLAQLPVLLDRMVQGTISIIHGDLNLENILVGPGGFVWLIDFAQTRQGHPLMDFAHLEAEIISHVIAQNYPDPIRYLEDFKAGRIPLLEGMNAIAARCLFNPAIFAEFDISLFFASIGALKYANLNQHQKQLQYITAAWLAQKFFSVNAG